MYRFHGPHAIQYIAETANVIVLSWKKTRQQILDCCGKLLYMTHERTPLKPYSMHCVCKFAWHKSKNSITTPFLAVLLFQKFRRGLDISSLTKTIDKCIHVILKTVVISTGTREGSGNNHWIIVKSITTKHVVKMLVETGLDTELDCYIIRTSKTISKSAFLTYNLKLLQKPSLTSLKYKHYFI